MSLDLRAFARPRPYEKSELSIWTDEWISRGMLAAHLDPSTDAASRKPETIARICDLIDGLLPRRACAGAGAGARVLDLGCGPGLYAENLARRGHKVVGVDFSARSIGAARERAAAAGLEIEYILGDYLTADIAGSFDCVTMIYCDLGTFGDADRDRVLDRAARLLNPGGFLAFDVFSEKYAAQARDERRWEVLGEGSFWSSRPCLLIHEGIHFPEAAAYCRNDHIIGEDGELRSYRTWDRYYSREDIRRFLEERGFSGVRAMSDVVPPTGFAPFETLFVTARLPVSRGQLRVASLLGKGKSGRSYLAESPSGPVVLKEMHDEEVPYYSFSKPKIEHELAAYEALERSPVKIPALLGRDREAGYLIKEYIEGETAAERLARGAADEGAIAVLLRWSAALRAAGLNIDYFPSNFVFGRGELYYVDYEINPYSDEWSFEEWGIYYWLNPAGFATFLRTGDPDAINRAGTGKPVRTAAAEEARNRLLAERDRRARGEEGAWRS